MTEAKRDFMKLTGVFRALLVAIGVVAGLLTWWHVAPPLLVVASIEYLRDPPQMRISRVVTANAGRVNAFYQRTCWWHDEKGIFREAVEVGTTPFERQHRHMVVTVPIDPEIAKCIQGDPDALVRTEIVPLRWGFVPMPTITFQSEPVSRT